MEIDLEVCSLKLIDRKSSFAITRPARMNFPEGHRNPPIHVYPHADTRSLCDWCRSHPDALRSDRNYHSYRCSVHCGKKQKPFGRAIATTFGQYVIFDLSRWHIIPYLAGIDALLFLTANIAMLIAVWPVIQEK
jgi:hypothetical protein